MAGTLYLPTDDPFTDPATGKVAAIWLRFMNDVQTGISSVPWASINFAGSSLADLQTRSATALTSGTLPLARLANIADAQISATAAIAWSKLAVPSLSQCALLVNSGAVAAGATTFIGPRGEDTTEANARVPLPVAGVLRNLYVVTDGVAGAGQSFTYTVRVNGADVALTTSIAGAAATTGGDLTHTATVSAGDLLDVKLVTSAAAGVRHHAIGLEIATT